MLNQPKILPSSDAEWKSYYERKCRAQEREVTKLRRGIDEALQYLAENENSQGVIGAVVILNRAIRHPLLRDNALMSHKWTGVQSDSHNHPGEYVRHCELCGIEDTCEDPLPPCSGAKVNK